MKRLAHIGTGNHKIIFIWTGYNCKEYCYTYHATSRADIAKILKEFRRALYNLRQKLKSGNITITINCLDRQLSFFYIAAHNPTCKIKTRTRDNKAEYKREYQFNYSVNGYQTFSSMRKAILKPTKLHRITFTEKLPNGRFF